MKSTVKQQGPVPVTISDMSPESLAELGITPEQAKRFDKIIHQQQLEAEDTERFLEGMRDSD